MNASSSDQPPPSTPTPSNQKPAFPRSIYDPMQIFLSNRYQNFALTNVPEGGSAANMPVNPTRFWEGCAVRSTMAGAGGYVIGMVMGGFFHTMGPMDYEAIAGK